MRTILLFVLINIPISLTLQKLDEYLLRNIENSIQNFTKKFTSIDDNYIDGRQYGLYSNNPIYGQSGLYSSKYDNKYGLHGELTENYDFQSTPSMATSFLRALESIAVHDTLRCIPKLLCNFMVDRIRSGHQQSSFIPNIDFTSLLSYIESLGQGARESPLLLFGKAALLGYSAQGNSYKCIGAYSRCPNNPDQLLDYLNNHNGGFFRFFNGIPNHSPNAKSIDNKIEKRILTKSTNTKAAYGTFHHNSYVPQVIKYPVQNHGFNNDYNLQTKEYIYVNGRFIPYNPTSIKYSSDPQIKVPSYSQVGVIFPDRTGTGELLLDSPKFDRHRLRFPFN